jgi:hypothetical protein
MQNNSKDQADIATDPIFGIGHAMALELVKQGVGEL